MALAEASDLKRPSSIRLADGGTGVVRHRSHRVPQLCIGREPGPYGLGFFTFENLTAVRHFHERTTMATLNPLVCVVDFHHAR